MPARDDFRIALHKLLDKHMNQEDVKTLYYYLRIDYDNLEGATKSAKLRSLLAEMERQDQINSLCDVVMVMRADLKPQISALNYPLRGSLPYLQSAINDSLPPPGIENILRDPEKIYLPLECADRAEQERGEDALTYIHNQFQTKQVVLIVGNYGTGKSYLTLKQFLKSAAAYQKEPAPRIPILLPLNELVERAENVLDKIIKHLRAHRLLDVMHRRQDGERQDIARRLEEGEFLCILDGFDEIPLLALRPHPLDELKTLVKNLAIGQNRVIITTRPGILPGILSPDFASSMPETAIGYLLPWHSKDIWHEYLRQCEQLGITFDGGYHAFEQWVISQPALKQLTATPLYCQMLVETRQEIMHTTDINLAQLYLIYAERYFTNVRDRGVIKQRFNNLPEEIKFKKRCLMATSVGMIKKNSIRLTLEELEDALMSEAYQYQDDQLKDFMTLDTLVYSLLVKDISQMVSFSHKSFYEFFAALKLSRELDEDAIDLLGRKLLTNEIITFLADLLASNHDLRTLFSEAFKSPAPLKQFHLSGRLADRKKVLLRNLALIQLELTRKLEGVELQDLDFNGCRLSSHQHPTVLKQVNMMFTQMEGAILTGVDLRGSHLRTVKLNRSILDKADLRDVDLTGAELQDISCQATRFSGANFTRVKINKQDALKIMLAIAVEKENPANRVDPAWVEQTEETLM
ncbi:MAG: NACHT domain-containing protein, partial [Ktedonobacteraceae bacterium]